MNTPDYHSLAVGYSCPECGMTQASDKEKTWLMCIAEMCPSNGIKLDRKIKEEL